MVRRRFVVLSYILLSIDDIGDKVDATDTRVQESAVIHLIHSLYSEVAYFPFLLVISALLA